MAQTRFRVNRDLTAAKAFEDEVVIINTVSGRYYDLGGSGTLVWSLLERGASLAEVAQALSAAYGVSEATARDDSEALLERLLAEDLVVADEAAAGSAGPAAPPA